MNFRFQKKLFFCTFFSLNFLCNITFGGPSISFFDTTSQLEKSFKFQNEIFMIGEFNERSDWSLIGKTGKNYTTLIQLEDFDKQVPELQTLANWLKKTNGKFILKYGHNFFNITLYSQEQYALLDFTDTSKNLAIGVGFTIRLAIQSAFDKLENREIDQEKLFLFPEFRINDSLIISDEDSFNRNYVIPNEKHPFNFHPFLDKKKGVLISVGTFRTLISAAWGSFDRVIMLDASDSVTGFNLAHLDFLKAINLLKIPTSHKRLLYIYCLAGYWPADELGNFETIDLSEYDKYDLNLTEKLEFHSLKKLIKNVSRLFAPYSSDEDKESFIQLITNETPLSNEHYNILNKKGFPSEEVIRKDSKRKYPDNVQLQSFYYIWSKFWNLFEPLSSKESKNYYNIKSNIPKNISKFLEIMSAYKDYSTNDLFFEEIAKSKNLSLLDQMKLKVNKKSVLTLVGVLDYYSDSNRNDCIKYYWESDDLWESLLNKIDNDLIHPFTSDIANEKTMSHIANTLRSTNEQVSVVDLSNVSNYLNKEQIRLTNKNLDFFPKTNNAVLLETFIDHTQSDSFRYQPNYSMQTIWQGM